MHVMVDAIWEEFLKIVKEEAGSRVVETWLKAVRLCQWDSHNRVVHLQAPNQFVQQWVCAHYMKLLQVHLARLLNVDQVKIVFEGALVMGTPSSSPSNGATLMMHPSVTAPKIASHESVDASASYSNIVRARERPITGRINHSYQFDNFIVGPSNSLAAAAAKAVTENPGRLYNPLFIYGGSGLGKTHLLHAIGNEIGKHHTKIMVLYQTADRFVNEFINAIRFDRIHKFQAKYKAVDVLLIDDIQFLSNKDQTQEAFFHIFNLLYDSHKQIIFTCDSVPKAINGLAERLRSRLEWGLVADIHVPTIETKIAILKKKAELNNEALSDEVAHFIASRVVCNIRELEGALIRVCAFAHLMDQSISLELAKKVLSHESEYKKIALTCQFIAKVVCKYYDYSLDVLRSSNRQKEISCARQTAMYLMKQLTDRSLSDIGHFFNRKDHSTVVHAVSKIHQLRQSDTEFNEKVKQMEQEILR
ncbi:MAG: chromosomal replication initiator protein DnaA [Candidatus Babeliales bacterium]